MHSDDDASRDASGHPQQGDDLETDRSSHAGRAMLLSTLAYWTATGAALLGAMLRGKVAAVFLGVSGVGVTAQLSTITALVAAVAALGISTGGVKLIADARARHDYAALSRVVSLVVWGPCTAALLTFGLTAAFSRPLSQALLGSQEYAGLFVVSMAAVPLNCLLASFQVVMQGHEMARRLSVNSVIAAAFTTAASIPLTIAFGVPGAVWAIPLASAATIAYFVHRERWLIREALPLRVPGAKSRRELRNLAGASVIAAAVTLGCDTLLRSIAIHRLGLDDNGLYQPAQVFTAVLMAQLAGALSLVLLPRLSYELGQGNNRLVMQTLRRAVETSMAFAVPLCLLAAALGGGFILVFFDSSFLASQGVLSVQAAAELPRFAAYALGAVLLPAGLVRQWLASTFLANAARLALSLALMDAIGLYALALGVVVMWVVTLGWTVLVLRRHMGWRAGRRLQQLSVASCFVVSLGVALSFAGTEAKAAIVLIAVAWVAVTGRREVAVALSVLRRRGGM